MIDVALEPVFDTPEEFASFLKQDRAAPRASYETMAARLRNPERVECEGSHQAMQTRPGAVATALLAALGNRPSRGST